jgi:hypothetical protein
VSARHQIYGPEPLEPLDDGPEIVTEPEDAPESGECPECGRTGRCRCLSRDP